MSNVTGRSTPDRRRSSAKSATGPSAARRSWCCSEYSFSNARLVHFIPEKIIFYLAEMRQLTVLVGILNELVLDWNVGKHLWHHYHIDFYQIGCQ